MGRAAISGLVILSVLCLAGCQRPVDSSSSARQAPVAAYRQVSAEEARELMAKEKGYIILDVRTEREFLDGHIPGAINIPNETIGSTEVSGLPDKGQLILVYCRSGNRSKQAAGKLAALGYANIVEFGGMNSWPGEIVTAP